MCGDAGFIAQPWVSDSNRPFPTVIYCISADASSSVQGMFAGYRGGVLVCLPVRITQGLIMF